MKACVLGLGAMGGYMAQNLDRAAMLGAVWNRTAARAQSLELGANVLRAPDPLAGVKDADVIITCVSRDADVLEVTRAFAPALKAGAIVCDTSTVSSDTARQLADIVRKQGADFLDCPVSGGVEGARTATLAMMVGGNAATLERARPALSKIAANIIHMGEVGAGQATKAVNQIMAAGINQAVTEALAFGQAQGLDMDKVIDVVGSGAAANWFLDKRGKTMVAGTYAPGFKVALHHKDLQIVRKMSPTAISTVEKTIADYEQLMAQGHGEEDISALFRLKNTTR